MSKVIDIRGSGENSNGVTIIKNRLGAGGGGGL